MLAVMNSNDATELTQQPAGIFAPDSSAVVLQGITRPTNDLVQQLSLTKLDSEILNEAQQAQVEREMEENKQRFTELGNCRNSVKGCLGRP